MSCGWFYNDVSGVVRHDCGIAYLVDLAAVKIGTWHGPYQTQALADAHAGVTGASPVGGSGLQQAVGGLTNATTQGLLPGLFTQRTFAIRLVEAIIGMGLILIGVKAVTT